MTSKEESILKYRAHNTRWFSVRATAGRMTQARAVWTQMMGISEASAEVTGNISHSLCLLSYHSVLPLIYNLSPHCHMGLVKLVLMLHLKF